MKRILFALGALALLTGGCSQQPAANNTPSKTASPASSPATTAKRETKKLPSANPVPADWITMSDDVKGYEFQVPAGTQHKTDTVNGVDVYGATVPAPYDVAILVFAFKDKTASKDDLLKKVEGILTAMGEKDIKVGDIKELSPDYSIATISSVDEKGKTTKGKVLVATDVTDNYIMMIGCDSEKYGANEKTMDEIWGSFGMYSGGYTGNS